MVLLSIDKGIEVTLRGDMPAFDLAHFGADRTDRLMFVLFTSGTTGQPKAVPGYEGPVLEGHHYFTSQWPYNPDDAVLHHITYTWADHKADVWHPLLSGKEIIIVPNVEELIQLAETPPPNVRHLFVVPTILNAILTYMEANQLDAPAFLSLVFVTGEALNDQTVKRFRSLVPGGRW